ncbi:hypothetical protein [Stenotrophomonas bentonitica]|uniref:hypothetical protein n=1 Tax=Stenotrophomonas bentonitica TaxID=1450134 RepID=UPI00345ED7D0
MTRVYGERAAELRKVFEAAPGQQLTRQSLYERMGATEVGKADERRNIRNALPALVRCGFVVKEGLGIAATYQGTGKAKKVPKAPAELAESKRQRNALRTAATAVRTRAARVAQQAANTPAPPKVKAIESGETVEQFLARGGRVQRLTAHWEQAA